jgi:nucleotide-binding universal stress UspA family protein
MAAEAEHETRDRIVVGVDETPLGAKALRWAVDQARKTGAEVEAVLAWHAPARMLLTPTSTDADYFERHQDALDRIIRDVVGDAADVPVHGRLVEHKAAPALVEAARGAQLLVVAARGERVVPGVQLGSVARYCADHAPCPVVVYREEGPPQAGIGH